MSDKETRGTEGIEEVQVDALSDEELDAVAGGAADVSTAPSCICCVATAITPITRAES